MLQSAMSSCLAWDAVQLAATLARFSSFCAGFRPLTGTSCIKQVEHHSYRASNPVVCSHTNKKIKLIIIIWSCELPRASPIACAPRHVGKFGLMCTVKLMEQREAASCSKQDSMNPTQVLGQTSFWKASCSFVYWSDFLGHCVCIS
jgi:hypothetical protein